MDSLLNIEEHPLEPFLPANAVLLMLGSFPPHVAYRRTYFLSGQRAFPEP